MDLRKLRYRPSTITDSGTVMGGPVLPPIRED
jgi:hypothetical protein